MSKPCQQITRNEVKTTFKSLKRKLEFYEREQARCKKRLKLMASLLTEEEKLELNVKLEDEKKDEEPRTEDTLESDDECIFVIPENEEETTEKAVSLSVVQPCPDATSEVEVTSVSQPEVTVIDDDVMIVEENNRGSSETTTSTQEDVTVTYVHLGDSANFPHQRSECVRHKFVPPPSWREKGCGPYEKNADFCNSCYCYLCDEEASKCQKWKRQSEAHCNAHRNSPYWRAKRKNRSALASFMNYMKIPDELNNNNIKEFVNKCSDSMKKLGTAFSKFRNGVRVEHDEMDCECECHHDYDYCYWREPDCFCDEETVEHDFGKVVRKSKGMLSEIKQILTDTSNGDGAVTTVYLMTVMLLKEDYHPRTDNYYNGSRNVHLTDMFSGLADAWINVLISGFVSADVVRKLQPLLRDLLSSFKPHADVPINVENLKKILKLLNYAHDLKKILDGSATSRNMVKYPEDLALFVFDKLVKSEEFKKALNFATIVEVKHEGSLQTFSSTDIVFMNREKVRQALPLIAIELGYIKPAEEFIHLPYSTKFRNGKLDLENFSMFKMGFKKSTPVKNTPLHDITGADLDKLVAKLLKRCTFISVTPVFEHQADTDTGEYRLALQIFARAIHINSDIRKENNLGILFRKICPPASDVKYQGVTASQKKDMDNEASLYVQNAGVSVDMMQKFLPKGSNIKIKYLEICLWIYVWACLKLTANLSHPSCSPYTVSGIMDWMTNRNLHHGCISFYKKIMSVTMASKKTDVNTQIHKQSVLITPLIKNLKEAGTQELEPEVYNMWISTLHGSSLTSLMELFITELKNKQGAEKQSLQKSAIKQGQYLLDNLDKRGNDYYQDQLIKILREKYYPLAQEIDNKEFVASFLDRDFKCNPSYSSLMDMKKLEKNDVTWEIREEKLMTAVEDKVVKRQLKQDKLPQTLEMFTRTGHFSAVTKLFNSVTNFWRTSNSVEENKLLKMVCELYDSIEYCDHLDLFHAAVGGFISKTLLTYLTNDTHGRSVNFSYNKFSFMVGNKTYFVKDLLEHLCGNVSSDKAVDVLDKAMIDAVEFYTNRMVRQQMKQMLVYWLCSMKELYIMFDKLDRFNEKLDWLLRYLRSKQALIRFIKDHHTILKDVEARVKPNNKKVKTRPISYVARIPSASQNTAETDSKKTPKKGKKKNTAAKRKKGIASQEGDTEIIAGHIDAASKAVPPLSESVTTSNNSIRTDVTAGINPLSNPCPEPTASTTVAKTMNNPSQRPVSATVGKAVANSSVELGNPADLAKFMRNTVSIMSTAVGKSVNNYASPQPVVPASTEKAVISPRPVAPSVVEKVGNNPYPPQPGKRVITPPGASTTVGVSTPSSLSTNKPGNKPPQASMPGVVSNSSQSADKVLRITNQTSSMAKEIQKRASVINSSQVNNVTPAFLIDPKTIPLPAASTNSLAKTTITPAVSLLNNVVPTMSLTRVTQTASRNKVPSTATLTKVVSAAAAAAATSPRRPLSDVMCNVPATGVQSPVSVSAISQPAKKTITILKSPVNAAKQVASISGPVTSGTPRSVMCTRSATRNSPAVSSRTQAVVTPGTAASDRGSARMKQYVPCTTETGVKALLQLPEGVDISHLPGAQLHPLKVGPAQAENQTDGTIVMLPVDQVHHVLRYLPKGAKVGTFLNPESVR